MIGTASRLLLLALGAWLCACGGEAGPADDGNTAEWPEWGGDKGGTHYSPLRQITPENVHRLELAWTHRTGVWSGTVIVCCGSWRPSMTITR